MQQHTYFQFQLLASALSNTDRLSIMLDQLMVQAHGLAVGMVIADARMSQMPDTICRSLCMLTLMHTIHLRRI